MAPDFETKHRQRVEAERAKAGAKDRVDDREREFCTYSVALGTVAGRTPVRASGAGRSPLRQRGHRRLPDLV